MIPSLLSTFALDELKKTRKKIQFNYINGASLDRIQQLREREEYLNQIIIQFRNERKAN